MLLISEPLGGGRGALLLLLLLSPACWNPLLLLLLPAAAATLLAAPLRVCEQASALAALPMPPAAAPRLVLLHLPSDRVLGTARAPAQLLWLQDAMLLLLVLVLLQLEGLLEPRCKLLRQAAGCLQQLQQLAAATAGCPGLDSFASHVLADRLAGAEAHRSLLKYAACMAGG